MRSRVMRLTGLLLASALGACAGRAEPMVSAPGTDYAARPDQALIVFLRPSTVGYDKPSSLFELVGDDEEFIGMLPALHKVAYYVAPGEHMFMVAGGSADFLRAQMDAGKIYYAVVVPRMGVWKARFSLRPVRGPDVESEQVQAWLGDCTYAVPTQESRAWAAENRENIADERRTYLPKWQARGPESREDATLRASDGR